MSLKTLVEDTQIKKGFKKDGVTPYFYVEVQETVRKFINPDKPQDTATLLALADSGQTIPQLMLHQRNNSLIFSSQDLD
jgi:hypothetical protein